MLIVVLTVIMAAAIGIAVFSMSDTVKHSPTAGISIAKTDGDVKLTHFSGAVIKKEDYKIVIDSVSYDGTIDFNVGTVLKYNAENANHVALVYTADGKDTIISEKYFGGSGLLESSIDAEITGFNTTSNPSEISDNIIFSTESRIGIIVKLKGDTAVEKPSASITNHDVGNLILWEEQSDASKYVYYIEKTGNEKYYTDGIENADVVFSDNAVPGKSCYGTVNIPPEADLTFKIGTYAKYRDGVFNKNGDNKYKYVGHGIIVKITGGSRKEEVFPFNDVNDETRLDYIIEVHLKDKTFKTGETKTNKGSDTLIEDYDLSKDDSKYFYIKNIEENRLPFDVEEYILKIKFKNGDIKTYTFSSKDKTDIGIDYHIPAWSPLYEDMWYPKDKPKSPDITYTVSAHTEENNPVRGIKVDITGGTFPAAKWGNNVYPVSMSAVLVDSNGETVKRGDDGDYKLVYEENNEPSVSSIESKSYIFKIDNDDYAELTDKKVRLTFTMKDLENKDGDSIKSSSYTSVSETITIPARNNYPKVEVSIDSYNKPIEFFKLSENNDKQNAVNCFSQFRGHGIILKIGEISDLNPNKKYSLDVTINDKYKFGNGLTEHTKEVKCGGVTVDFGAQSGSSFSNNFILLDDVSKAKGDTYYFWIGPHTNEEAVGKFTSAKVVVNLYEDGKKINTIYDKSIDIPARDIITVKKYNEGGEHGLILTLNADLSDIVENPKLKMEYYAGDKTYSGEGDGNTLKVPIGSASGTVTAENVKVTIENTAEKYDGLSEDIKLYYYEFSTTSEGTSSKPIPTNPSIEIS